MPRLPFPPSVGFKEKQLNLFERETALDVAAYHAARNIVAEVQEFTRKFACDLNRRRGSGPEQWENPFELLLHEMWIEDDEILKHFAQELDIVRKQLRW